MFKLLAGIFIFAIGLYDYRQGFGASDLYMLSAFALIGAGLDTIFHKK